MGGLGAPLSGLIWTHRKAWAFVAIITLVRLVLCAQTGLGDDEAYYWDWSRRLDWSYYDHPPMVAWLIALSTGLLGDNPLAVRAPFIGLSVVAGGQCLVLARQLWPRHPRRAGLAMVALHLTPVLALGAVFAAPDMPLWVCWLGLICAARRAHRRDRRGDWVLLGGVAGLAMLSKYTAILAILGVFGWLISTPRGRQQLRSPGPWLGICVSLVAFAPVVIWNARHQWISFGFHLSGRHVHEVDVMAQLGTFIGSQFLAISPVLLVAGFGGLIGPGRCPPKLVSLLRWQAAPVLLLFAMTSPLTRFKAHWTAPGFLIASILAFGWMAHRRRPSLWWGAALGCAGVLTGLLYSQAVHPVLPIPARDDPTHDLVGWDEVAVEVESLCPEPDCVVVTHMYQLAAQAAFAMPNHRVLRLGDRQDQYGLWQEHGETPWSGVWVSHDRYFFDPEAQPGPWSCERRGELPVQRAGVEVRRFSFWRCQSQDLDPQM